MTFDAKAWFQSHREELLVKARLYYQDHREQLLTYGRAYYQEHKTEKAAYIRAYRKGYRKRKLSTFKACPICGQPARPLSSFCSREHYLIEIQKSQEKQP